jgi:predicted dehydrogenase
VKAIFSEKPLAINREDAEEIVQLAEKKGVLLAVNYTRRYAEKLNEVKDHIHSGRFGDIQTINGYYTNGTMHNGTHWFDLARFFVGEVRRVKGFDRLKEKNDDPTYEAYIEFNNGATGFLHSCAEKQFSIFEMDILGSNGRISLKESGHILELSKVTDSRYYSGYHSLHVSEIFTNVLKNALLYAIEDIVQCIQTGKTPRCSGDDGVAALKIAQAIGSSVASGNFVELES